MSIQRTNWINNANHATITHHATCIKHCGYKNTKYSNKVQNSYINILHKVGHLINNIQFNVIDNIVLTEINNTIHV